LGTWLFSRFSLDAVEQQRIRSLIDARNEGA